MPELTASFVLSRGDFSLQVEVEAPSGITVLFGPSGAGKSTVLAAVAGLLMPSRGFIRLGDERLFDSEARVHLPARERQLGYVVQSLALFPHLTVLKNVTFGLSRLERSERRRRAEALLERLGIAACADRFPGQLSGGERQRVALARALAGEPRLLLLDEPFAALDRPRRRDLLSLVKAVVAERGIPALFVTHDAAEAEAIGDRAIVLEAGRVVARGRPAEVLAG